MTEIEKINAILSYLKETFVGKDDIIDLLGLTLVAKENAFLLGPPGTAKSAIVKQLSRCISDGNNFEYLLTRFTEPNEIFGPFDIRKLKNGELVTNTEGMLPEASMVFLDEIFNANSAILNSLLMALNERMFRRGKESRKIPALMFVGASNLLPDDESLNALLDRFLIRVKCDYVDPDDLESVLVAGRKLAVNQTVDPPQISPVEILTLQESAKNVDLSAVRKEFINLVHNLRNTGVNISDRRAVKIENLISASTILSGRNKANISDLWVLKYIWDTEEQIEILAGIVDKILDKEETEQAHPQAKFNKIPDAEELLKDIETISAKWDSNLTFEERNLLKDKLRFLQTRVGWITKAEHKKHIEEAIELVWQKMLQEA